MIDRNRLFLRVWSHLLEKSLMENFIFCAVKSNNYVVLIAFMKTVCQKIKYILQRTSNRINLSPTTPAIELTPGRFVTRPCSLSSGICDKKYKRFVIRHSFDSHSEDNISQKLSMPRVISFLFRLMLNFLDLD